MTLMSVDETDLIYGAITLLVFLWTFMRGDASSKVIGATTMGGWFYFQTASYVSHYSLEQVLFALGDAAQAAIIIGMVYRSKMGLWALVGFSVAFLAMMGLHMSVLLTKPLDFYRYHLALNLAYIVQLTTIGGIMARHEFSTVSSRLRNHFTGLGHRYRGAHK